MFAANFFLATLLVIVQAVEIPPEIRSLPVPSNFIIHHCTTSECSGIKGRIEFRNDEVNREVLERTAFINMYIVDKANSTFKTLLHTNIGRRIKFHYENSSYGHMFTAEAEDGVPFEDVIATLVRVFSRSLSHDRLSISQSRSIREDTAVYMASIARGIIKSKRQVKAITVTRPINPEETLIPLIRSINAQNVTVNGAAPWNISDAFYRDPAVMKLNRINIENVEYNGITEKTLVGLNATYVDLGNAPAISAAGVRRFLKSVLDGRLQERSIACHCDFAAEEIFVNYTLSEGTLMEPTSFNDINFDTTLWTVKSPPPVRKAVFKRVMMKHGWRNPMRLFVLTASPN